MSHSIIAFETSVFRVKDADAFLAALAPLSPTFSLRRHHSSGCHFSLIVAEDCECWPVCNESAYAENEIPEGLDPDDLFDFAVFLQPHLCHDSACVVKHVNIAMRQSVDSVHLSLDVITPDGTHYFYPDSIFKTIPGADRYCVEWY